LQLDVSFLRHLLANLHQSILQPLAGRFAVELGELTKADGGLLACRSVLIANARSVLQQNVAGGVRFAAAKQFFDVLLHVARRNAPGLSRHQHLAFAGFRNSCPELAIEHVGMRFEIHAGVRQFFFARFQKFA